MTPQDFAARLGPDAHVEQHGESWSARCPAHADSNPSLTFTESPKGLLVKCHAGCETSAVLSAMGLQFKDLFNDSKKNGNGKFNIVAEYPYHDAEGNVLFEVVRLDPKDFRQRRPDPTARGGYSWSLKGVQRVLFRLPAVLMAVASKRRIYVCEGEKDVLAMEAAGFTATCNPGGAAAKPKDKKWLEEYTSALRGANVTIIADKDEAGRRHAQTVAASLHGSALSVRVIELPDINGKPVKDAADYLGAGGTSEDIEALSNSAPEWTPKAESYPEPPPSLSSFDDGPPLEHYDWETLGITPESFEHTTSMIRGRIIEILQNEDLNSAEQRRQIANAVSQTLSSVGRLYYHADLRDFDSAMFFNATEKRLLRIRSDAFPAWLSQWLRINRADTLFKYVQAEVETAALSGPHTTGIIPESFWASRDTALYVSNGDGHMVKITPESSTVVDNGTDGVLFPVGRTLAPWKLDPATSKDIFTTCSIFQQTHTTAPHAIDLLRLWLYSLPTNPRSKPPLCLTGEIGSGKTRLAKAFSEFLGIPFIAHKVEESAEADFWPCCDAGGILTLDNADTRCKWLPDALASASTDGCSQRRKLYTNAETVTLRSRAWLIITSANPTFAADSGLSDRLLLVRMQRHDETETSDNAITREIISNRDAGLSHLCLTLQSAISQNPPRNLGNLNSRHPDFATFGVRIGMALQRPDEAMIALQNAEADKSAFCLENDTIATALLAFLSKNETLSGTAAEIAPKLIEIDPDLDGKLSAKRLGKRLNALWPHLQKVLKKATREQDRQSVTRFSFSAGFAGFQTAFSNFPLM